MYRKTVKKNKENGLLLFPLEQSIKETHTHTKKRFNCYNKVHFLITHSVPVQNIEQKKENNKNL